MAPSAGLRMTVWQLPGAGVYHLYPECVPFAVGERLVELSEAGQLRLCSNCAARRRAGLLRHGQLALELLSADPKPTCQAHPDALLRDASPALPTPDGVGVEAQRGGEFRLAHAAGFAPGSEAIGWGQSAIPIDFAGVTRA